MISTTIFDLLILNKNNRYQWYSWHATSIDSMWSLPISIYVIIHGFVYVSLVIIIFTIFLLLALISKFGFKKFPQMALFFPFQVRHVFKCRYNLSPFVRHVQNYRTEFLAPEALSCSNLEGLLCNIIRIRICEDWTHLWNRNIII